MPRIQENGLTKRQQEVLKLIRKGSRVTVKSLIEEATAHAEKTGNDPVPNEPVAGYHLGRLELTGYLELIEGGGRGQTRTWKRVA